MASYVPNGRQQFLDANGVPLALGSVGMYVVGTLTPANTWQDSGKTTLNANPIPLDAGGFAMIYGSGQYRQIVKDAAGNVIWDRVAEDADNGLRADLAAGNATVNSKSTVNITPAAGTNVGLAIAQTYTGAASGFNGNTIQVADDSDVVGANFSIALYIQHNFGGSSATGGRSAVWIDAKNEDGATNAVNTNRNYVGITAQGWAVHDDAGTGLTGATAKGAFFGVNGVGIAESGATNLLNVTGGEFNTAVKTGSSVANKAIIQLSGEPTDAVSGSSVDAMIWAYDQGGAGGHNDGLLFDAATSFGNQWPIKSSGNLIRTTGGSVANGIDISATTISGSAFKSPGFSVNGAGTILSLTPVTVASLPSAGTAGRRAFVSDASATTFASIVAGSGTNKVPVYDDGTNWRIG